MNHAFAIFHDVDISGVSRRFVRTPKNPVGLPLSHSSYKSLPPLPEVVYFFLGCVLFSTNSAKIWPIIAILRQIYALGVLLQVCPCPAWTLWVCPWTPISIKVSPKFCPSIIHVVSKYWKSNSQVVPKYCPSIDQVVSSNAQVVTNLSLSIARVLFK